MYFHCSKVNIYIDLEYPVQFVHPCPLDHPQTCLLAVPLPCTFEASDIDELWPNFGLFDPVYKLEAPVHIGILQNRYRGAFLKSDECWVHLKNRK